MVGEKNSKKKNRALDEVIDKVCAVQEIGAILARRLREEEAARPRKDPFKEMIAGLPRTDMKRVRFAPRFSTVTVETVEAVKTVASPKTAKDKAERKRIETVLLANLDLWVAWRENPGRLVGKGIVGLMRKLNTRQPEGSRVIKRDTLFAALAGILGRQEPASTDD